MADEILHIADESASDTVTDEYGRQSVNHEVVQRSRLRVDTRKWLLSKMRPGLYGDKLGLTGGDGKGPVEVVARWETE